MPIFWAPSSTLGEIYMRAKWLYCREFNSKQLLLEAFFHDGDFSQRLAQKWIYFPIWVQ